MKYRKFPMLCILLLQAVGCMPKKAVSSLKDAGGAGGPQELSKCNACHQQRIQERLLTGSVIADPNVLAEVLPYLNKSFLGEMIAQAKFTPPERDAFDSLLKRRIDAVSNAPSQTIQCADQNQGQLNQGQFGPGSGQGRQGEFAQASGTNLPLIDPTSSLLAGVLYQAAKDNRLFPYEMDGVPRPWQKATVDADLASLLTDKRPVNPDMFAKMGYNSDAAREFPWLHTAGTDTSESTQSRKYVISGGQQLGKIGVRTKDSAPSYFGTSTNVNGPQVGWEFSNGTVFVEVLQILDPTSQQSFPFEIRMRIKIRAGLWQMDVLRPFASEAELKSAISNVCNDPALSSVCGNLRSIEFNNTRSLEAKDYVNAVNFGKTRADPSSPQNDPSKMRDPLVLSATAIQAVLPRAMVSMLPNLDPALVRALLTKTKFKSVFNTPWTRAARDERTSVSDPAATGWAPTTEQEFSIVPKKYFAAFIPMNHDGCINCHSTAGKHVDNYDPDPTTQMNASAPDDAKRPRTWYNFIPGDDAILSFHPFAAQAIMGNQSVPIIENGGVAPGTIRECLSRVMPIGERLTDGPNLVGNQDRRKAGQSSGVVSQTISSSGSSNYPSNYGNSDYPSNPGDSYLPQGRPSSGGGNDVTFEITDDQFWNSQYSADNPLVVHLGDRIHFVNRGQSMHGLHTGGKPCQHTGSAPPGGEFVCVVDRNQEITNGQYETGVRDHEGNESPVYIRVVP